MPELSVDMCCNPNGEKYSSKRISFGRDISTSKSPLCPNYQCCCACVSVVSGYITEEENMYRKHSVVDYSSVELLTYWSDEVRSGRELNCTLVRKYGKNKIIRFQLYLSDISYYFHL